MCGFTCLTMSVLPRSMYRSILHFIIYFKSEILTTVHTVNIVKQNITLFWGTPSPDKVGAN